MISSIRIQNFQSHDGTEIQFHPGLNVIVGSGDSGKTAVHRALRWAQSNRIRQDDRPMGDGFISRWAKKTSAKGTVTLIDDCRVTVTKPEGTCTRFRDAARSKNDKESNGYLLNGERFEAIGVGVPDAVSQWFNWSDVNVQKQHDQAFLISKGAGEVASFLNRTVRLDTIDAHIQAAGQLVRQERDALKLLEAMQATDQKSLEALEWVPGAVGRLEALEALDKQVQGLQEARSRLSRVMETWVATEVRIAEQNATIALEPRVRKLRKEWDWFRGLMEQGHRVRDAVDKWMEAESIVQRAGKLADLEPRAVEVRGLWKQKEALDVRIVGIEALIVRWECEESALSRASHVAAFGDRVKGLRELADRALAADACAGRMEHWVREWDKASKAVGKPVDWEDLEFQVKRVRALARKLDGIQSEREALAKWALTFAGLEATIQRSTETLATLEAGRPETCPLCGGPMHKEHGA